MEEKENEPAGVAEENLQPTRDEILAMSRAENKGCDEVKKEVYKTGSRLALRVGVIIAIIFSAICLILKTGEELLLPMYSVVLGMVAAYLIFIGVKERKKFVFILAVLMAVCVVVFTVLEILILCGIIV